MKSKLSVHVVILLNGMQKPSVILALIHFGNFSTSIVCYRMTVPRIASKVLR